MFKESFKYYKAKIPPPDLSEVINVDDLQNHQNKVEKISIKQSLVSALNYFDLNPLESWNAYEFKEKPGLILIRNPFTSLGQRYWTTRCLEYYTRKPNKLNLDPFNLIPHNENWWQLCQRTKNFTLLKKLRWATLGYHHNWDTKIYTEESKGKFPEDLTTLTKAVVSVLGYDDFLPQAAIVNFYHMDSTLSGHTDHSEVNLEAPLVSFSFGQSAIFLLGGKTLEEKPVALFLHSGDVLIMTKDIRLCYHGVPKILEAVHQPWDKPVSAKKVVSLPEQYSSKCVEECQNEDTWRPYGAYLNTSRININVRQVLHKDQDHL